MKQTGGNVLGRCGAGLRDSKGKRRDGHGAASGVTLIQKTALTEVRGFKHLIKSAYGRDDEIVFKGNGFKLCLGALGQPRFQEFIDFSRVLLAHGPQVLVARLRGPLGVTHYLYKPHPLFTGAPADADRAVLARQDHIGVGSARTGCASATARPLQSVVNIDPAVARNIAGQNF